MTEWLPLAAFFVHVCEEWKRFPAWATRHFGATSRAWFVYSHLPLIAAIAGICAWSSSAAGSPRAAGPHFFALGLAWCLAGNALFHLVATAALREYSPGVVTGALLFFPLAAARLHAELSLRALSPSQMAQAIALGLLVQALVVASLWLPMDLDWRLRRPRSRPAPP